MSGLELINALRDSGTGENKLTAARDVVEARPDATALDVLAALEAEAAKPGSPVGRATIDKAMEFATAAPAAV